MVVLLLYDILMFNNVQIGGSGARPYYIEHGCGMVSYPTRGIHNCRYSCCYLYNNCSSAIQL